MVKYVLLFTTICIFCCYVHAGDNAELTKKVELIVTGNFPQDVPIEPKVATLNGRDIREDTFAPGEYQLRIEHPGYVSIDEKVSLIESLPFVLRRQMTGKPRPVVVHVSYDIDPETMAHAIVFRDSKSKETRELDGDMAIAPGEYQIEISQPGYDPAILQKRILPAEEPFYIVEELRASAVSLYIRIAYDVMPPHDLPPCRITLAEERKGIPCQIDTKAKVKPGKYYLTIHRPGYESATQLLEVAPSSQVLQVWQRLDPRPRSLCFLISDEGKAVSPERIVDKESGEEANFEGVFYPGETREFSFHFSQYRTVEQKLRIVPGAGPMVVEVPLKKLKSCDFFLKMKDVTLDNILYPLSFHIDNALVEPQHIALSPLANDFYHCRIWINPDAKKLLIGGGYLFVERYLNSLDAINALPTISLRQLIKHLEKLATSHGYLTSLDVLEQIVSRSSFRRSLTANSDGIMELHYFASKWHLDSEGDRQRLKSLLYKLRK